MEKAVVGRQAPWPFPHHLPPLYLNPPSPTPAVSPPSPWMSPPCSLPPSSTILPGWSVCRGSPRPAPALLLFHAPGNLAQLGMATTVPVLYFQLLCPSQLPYLLPGTRGWKKEPVCCCHCPQWSWAPCLVAPCSEGQVWLWRSSVSADLRYKSTLLSIRYLPESTFNYLYLFYL